MKSFKTFIRENNVSVWNSDRVYRVDPVGRQNVFKRYSYAILGKDGKDVGTAPLPQNHNVKPGNQLHGHDVHEVKDMAFASPGKPNAFYGAFGRSAGSNGTPVKGAAIYDESKMWSKDGNSEYKGEIHTTEENLKNMPSHISVHSAAGENWRTESFSGKEEVTSEHPATDVKHEGNIPTMDLLKRQYKIVIHPNVESIKQHISSIREKDSKLSILDQT